MSRAFPGAVVACAVIVGVLAFDPLAAATPGPQKTPAPRKQSRPKTRDARPAPEAPRKPDPSPPLQSASAQPESEVAQLARVRAKRHAVELEIARLKTQAESTLGELDSIDLEIRRAAHNLAETEIELKETTRVLDATIRDIQVTRARLEATRPRVMKSLTALNKLGELSYARLLFSLDDPADILRGYRYVFRIASTDGDQIRMFKADLLGLEDLQSQLKTRTAESLDKRRRMSEAKADLATRKSRKQERLSQIAEQRDLRESLAEEYKAREAELIRLLGEAGEMPVLAGPEITRVPPASLEGVSTLHAQRGMLPWPVGGTLMRKFGLEKDARFGTRTIQQGIEIDAFPEIEVKAVHPGRVVFADQFVGYGMLVIVDHGQREHTLYGRLGELRVSVGDIVGEGSLLGLLPNTVETGSGLHFEVRVQGRPEDPLGWLRPKP